MLVVFAPEERDVYSNEPIPENLAPLERNTAS
jgi:hypothetical protein